MAPQRILPVIKKGYNNKPITIDPINKGYLLYNKKRS